MRTVVSHYQLNWHQSSRKNIGANNKVHWVVASEEETAYFELERSIDGKEFTYLSTVSLKNNTNNYTYWDRSPKIGSNYYRLKMYDKSGNYEYSRIVDAFVDMDNVVGVEASPNPVSEILTVRITGNRNSEAKIVLMDVTGTVMKQQRFTGTELKIDMKYLVNGVYFLRYSDATHSRIVKITKV